LQPLLLYALLFITLLCLGELLGSVPLLFLLQLFLLLRSPWFGRFTGLLLALKNQA
jgi:hypothetical protein